MIHCLFPFYCCIFYCYIKRIYTAWDFIDLFFPRLNQVVIHGGFNKHTNKDAIGTLYE